MKVKLFGIFDRTFGALFRGIELTLRGRAQMSTLHYHVNQLAIQDSAKYAMNNFFEAMICNTREELWVYCIERSSMNPPQKTGAIVEFGVWKGYSINFFAKNCPESQVYGFDSFEGLEEDWTGILGHLKGHFNLDGKVPKVEKNVQLFKGRFENTVPSFASKLNKGDIRILHLDADTYKPTSYVLNSLSKIIESGTIVIFDEYFGYPNFRSHEFKAWGEFINSNKLKYRYIAYAELAVAVEIL